jgi:hypothetical protein
MFMKIPLNRNMQESVPITCPGFNASLIHVSNIFVVSAQFHSFVYSSTSLIGKWSNIFLSSKGHAMLQTSKKHQMRSIVLVQISQERKKVLTLNLMEGIAIET